MDEVKARRAIVLARRQAGATFRTIGTELGISQSRAAQLHAKALADAAHNERSHQVTLATPLPDLPLSYRSRMALAHCRNVSVADLLKQDKATRTRRLLSISNFGRQQLAELEMLLEKARTMFGDISVLSLRIDAIGDCRGGR